MSNSKYLTYKGKPLVRCGNEIYYGSMGDKFIIHLLIKSEEKLEKVSVPNDITVQLMYTDPDIRAKDRIVKTSQKDGLSKAMEIAEVWLTKALAGK